MAAPQAQHASKMESIEHTFMFLGEPETLEFPALRETRGEKKDRLLLEIVGALAKFCVKIGLYHDTAQCRGWAKEYVIRAIESVAIGKVTQVCQRGFWACLCVFGHTCACLLTPWRWPIAHTYGVHVHIIGTSGGQSSLPLLPWRHAIDTQTSPSRQRACMQPTEHTGTHMLFSARTYCAPRAQTRPRTFAHVCWHRC